MSEFKVPEVSSQTLVQQNMQYNVTRLTSQTLMQPVAHAVLRGLKGSQLRAVISPLRLTGLKGMYLRASALKDMSKPLHVSEVSSQTLHRVTTDISLSKVEVVVMQSQQELQIPDEADGLLQSHIY